jgi:hypothetical protein
MLIMLHMSNFNGRKGETIYVASRLEHNLSSWADFSAKPSGLCSSVKACLRRCMPSGTLECFPGLRPEVSRDSCRVGDMIALTATHTVRRLDE